MRGFTLIELVIVIALIGIMSIYANAKLSAMGSFNTATQADVAASLISRAQVKAVAGNMQIFIQCNASTSQTTISACLDSGCAQQAHDFSGQALTQSIPQNTSTACNGASSFLMLFNGAGEPVNGSTNAPLTTSVVFTLGNTSLTVEPGTGYAWRTP